MLIPDTERKLLRTLQEDTYIMGVAHAGKSNLAGPVKACALLLDFKKLPENIDLFIQGKLDIKQNIKVLEQLQYSIYSCETTEQNEIGDINTIIQYAQFTAGTKLMWKMFKNKKVPHAFLSEDYLLQDVVKLDISAENTDNKYNKKYRVMSSYSSLTELAVGAFIGKVSKEESISVAAAKRVAQIALDVDLKKIDKAIPEYHILDYGQKKQIGVIKKLGNTPYHRLYNKLIAKYPLA